MSIQVSISAGNDAASSTVNVSGYIQHIITDTEVNAFKINDALLKGYIENYFGKAPDDAYLHSPTPWNDLYKTYGWPQVQTTLSVVSFRILEVTSAPTIVASQIFKNESSVPADFNCGITQEVNVTTESTWSNSSTLEVGQTISYDISFLGSGAGGETSLSYSETWEQGGSESESITLGSNAGVTLTLQPQQSVISELSANKGVIKVEVVYQQTLVGVAAINYGSTFKGHHFWALDINDIMASAHLPLSLTTTENIEVDYYTNSTIVVKDSKGGIIDSFVIGPLHA